MECESSSDLVGGLSAYSPFKGHEVGESNDLPAISKPQSMKLERLAKNYLEYRSMNGADLVSNIHQEAFFKALFAALGCTIKTSTEGDETWFDLNYATRKYSLPIQVENSTLRATTIAYLEQKNTSRNDPILLNYVANLANTYPATLLWEQLEQLSRSPHTVLHRLREHAIELGSISYDLAVKNVSLGPNGGWIRAS